MAISDLANPTRFLAFANRTIPWLGGLAVVPMDSRAKRTGSRSAGRAAR